MLSKLVELKPHHVKIIKLIALGYTNAEIGQEMFLAECTIKTHLKRIMRYLDVGCRAEIVHVAWCQGYLDSSVQKGSVV